jgi:hypothetical protein
MLDALLSGLTSLVSAGPVAMTTLAAPVNLASLLASIGIGLGLGISGGYGIARIRIARANAVAWRVMEEAQDGSNILRLFEAERKITDVSGRLGNLERQTTDSERAALKSFAAWLLRRGLVADGRPSAAMTAGSGE